MMDLPETCAPSCGVLMVEPVGLVVDHRRVVGILADAGHVEEVERHVGLELQPLEQGVQIVGRCGRNGARTSVLGEEAVFGESQRVGVGSVVLADAVDDVSGRLVVRDDQRKFHRGRSHGPDERIVELRGGGARCCRSGAAAEAQAAGESEVDLEVPRDGGV